MKIKFFTIPNLLTLSNLLCGSVAAVAALVWGNLTLAFGLMILAAVFDFFDGFTARLLDQSSPIGLQLDSLADDITFGFAPAAAMYVLYQRMRCGWRNSTSTTRSARSSADCLRRPPRCSAPRSVCWPSVTG